MVQGPRKQHSDLQHMWDTDVSKQGPEQQRLWLQTQALNHDGWRPSQLMKPAPAIGTGGATGDPNAWNDPSDAGNALENPLVGHAYTWEDLPEKYQGPSGWAQAIEILKQAATLGGVAAGVALPAKAGHFDPTWIRQPENLELAHVMGAFAAQILAGGLPEGTGPNGSVPWPTQAKGGTGNELKDYLRDEKRAATDQYGVTDRGYYQIGRDADNQLQAKLRDDAENGWTYAPGNPQGITPGTMPGTPSLPNAPHNQLDGVYGVTPEQRNDKLRSATGGRLME